MTTRGWCPSLAAPMPAADGLLVRLRPRFGVVAADDARLIAEAAGRHGNGLIELTNRGNLQLRGFSRASAALCAAMIGRLDQPAQRPTLLTGPLLGIDPAMHPDTMMLANRIADDLAALPALAGPAEKFFVTLDGGGVMGIGDMRADIMIRADRGAWLLRRDGADAVERCDSAAVPDRVREELELYRAHGVARMRDLVPGSGIAGPVTRIRATPWPVVGFFPSAAAFGVGLPFGAMDAATLIRLADLSVQFGDGVLRLTPWRAIVLAGVAPALAPELVNVLSAAVTPLITDQNDPRRNISACVGRNFCAAATTDTRADALTLASCLTGLHVSGCAKGCAHPSPVPITLVGNDGGYDIVRNGKAGDTPVRTRLSLAAITDYLGVRPEAPEAIA
ncbi:MAG: precorrin-3B synthase [Acidiphilium sp.]|nr:precorrin-3B synthase [Acidiphilium sp.]MDD4935584.1 precorrin-3B synthase [Acidiphilium sp.]